MRKKEKGITLIALVITIIVLLILAGVALSMVAGNEGILTKAEKAVSETNITGAKEQVELMIAEISADYYEKKFVDKTESGKLVNYIKNALATEKPTSNGEFSVSIDGSGNVSVTDKGGNSVVEGTLDESGKIIWDESAGGNGGNGGNGGSGSGVAIPEGLEVGATVTYAPSGTYNWEAKYASSDLADDGTADVALASGSSVAEDSQDMSITSWKVLSIDENTGKVDLVPSAPTTGTVRLYGAQGYNNAVKLLNDACSSLYGNSSKGISARSINIEDIESAMTDEALEIVKTNDALATAHNLAEPILVANAKTTGKVDLVASAPTTVRLQGTTGYNNVNTVKLLNDTCSNLYGNSSKRISARSIIIEDIEGAITDKALAAGELIMEYGKQADSPYTENKAYPTIYGKENLSVINGIKKENGLGMSEQTALIGRTDEGAELGKITTATNIQPYQTFWRCDNAFMQTAFKGDGYNLLIPSGTDTNYWVASRCVGAGSGICVFRVRGVGYDGLSAGYLFSSDGDSAGGPRALFPVVSLAANVLTGDSASGWSVE